MAYELLKMGQFCYPAVMKYFCKAQMEHGQDVIRLETSHAHFLLIYLHLSKNVPNLNLNMHLSIYARCAVARW